MEALVSFIIQFCNNAFKGVVHYPALLAFIQKTSEPLKLALCFFKQAQSGTHYLTCRAITAIFKPRGYKVVEVGPKRNTGIPSHEGNSCTKYWYILPEYP